MGRSVWTPCNAIQTVFFDLEPASYCNTCDCGTHGPECPDCGNDTVPDYDCDAMFWDDLIDGIQETVRDKYPSFVTADSWPERESHCILENDLVRIEVSEYCYLVALSVVSKDHDTGYYGDQNLTGLANRFGGFVGQFLTDTWGRLAKQGTMSNGESVYRRVS